MSPPPSSPPPPPSDPSPSPDLAAIFDRFHVPPGLSFHSAEPYGSGHINDTYRVRCVVEKRPDGARGDRDPPAGAARGPDVDGDGEDERHYVLQRINRDVFPNPGDVMENVFRVTRHLSEKVRARGGDPTREVLTLVPTKVAKDDAADAAGYYAIVDGEYWRVYDFIHGATAYEIGDDAANTDTGDRRHSHVREAAAAFARFQSDASDIPNPPRLRETIPKFGDSLHRYRQLQDAISADLAGRVTSCRPEIDFCLNRKADISLFSNLLSSSESGSIISERVVHYDTKINNVLIDDVTGRGLCVIDLDTVMPGLAIYDFGDAVRAASALSSEDERDLTKVGFSMEKFEQLAEGYMSVAGGFLTDVEVDHMAMAAKIVTLTVGMRFLADHLSGDVYFKVQRDGQNLDRARTQLKTVADMEGKFDEMRAVVDRYRWRGEGGEKSRLD